MRFTILFAFIFFIAIGGCVNPASAAPWFVGEFQGRKPDDPAEPQMSVVCKEDERCVVLSMRRGGDPTPVGIAITSTPKPLDPAIPNNNWETTREAASLKPDWYKDLSFGPTLTSLRSALQSQARFVKCVDIDGTAYLALCSMSIDPESTQSVMLLVSTMNGRCGTLPFCAYYFLPLERVRK